MSLLLMLFILLMLEVDADEDDRRDVCSDRDNNNGVELGLVGSVYL